MAGTTGIVAIMVVMRGLAAVVRFDIIFHTDCSVAVMMVGNGLRGQHHKADEHHEI